jgi:hypothetical protein
VGALLFAYFTLQGVARVVRESRDRSAAATAVAGGVSAGPGASTTATTGTQADWAVGGCARAHGISSGGDTEYVPVDCAGPAASAKVVKLLPETTLGLSEPDCPDQTDLVVSGIGLRSHSGTACLRNLRAPHPGDPGAGGGILRAGDCIDDPIVTVKEVPCSDRDKARYKIAKRVAARADCNGGPSVTLRDEDLERPVLCLSPAQRAG